jgi:YVTN family beta-propeller protein
MHKPAKTNHSETSYGEGHIGKQRTPSDPILSGTTLRRCATGALGTFALAGLSLSASFPAIASAQVKEACSGHLYAANSFSDNVSVIDTYANEVVATIPVGHHPAEMTFTPDHKQIYVSNSADDTISVIDVATNTVVNTIPVDNFPLGLAFTPDGKHLVVSYEPNVMRIITMATGEAGPPIRVGLDSEQIRMTPDGKYVYALSTLNNRVDVLDVDKAQITATIPITNANGGAAPPFPYNALMSPDGKTLYVGAIFDSFVAVIDTQSNAVVNTWPAKYPVGMQYSLDHTKLYITNYYGASSIGEYDAATGELLRSHRTVHKPSFMAVREDGKYAYFGQAYGTTMTVFDTDKWTVKKKLTVGKGTNAVLICNSPSP